ncbi:F-box/LRR-repeat protein 13 [Morus notabilis]|uniref:F-box/LRR-repeat protein 13 n=1 Tax=Morus notabilis TaxID=981085 RepID=W9RJ47_9ROSA|nr:F-box/LRR-repeat protein 13 [Morus notabilis]
MLDGSKKGEESHCAEVDRISKLSDSIIHHILAFLPAVDVVRMSLLSKRWRRMWYSVPTLNFCDLIVPWHCHKARFNKFVDNCLKYREIGMRYIADSTITRLELVILYDGDNANLDKWLNFVVVKNKVEELDLFIRPIYGHRGRYCVPKAVLNAQSLTLLKLDGLKVKSPLLVSLPCLKLLSLREVSGLNDHSLEDLVANCPSLEKLVVSYCGDLSTPQVSSSSLKSCQVELESHQRIEIEAINLESLHFRGTKRQSCETSLATCRSLKSLSLFEVELDGRWLEDYISEHTLENLTISGCLGWKHIKNIRSRHLKNLVLSQKSIKEVDAIIIDAVNLISFTYNAYNMKRFFNISLNSPNLLVCNVKLLCECCTYDTSWYVSLICLLSNLHCSTNMCLRVYSEEALIFPNELRSFCRSLLLAVEHLKVKTLHPLSKSSDLRDAMYWLSPSLKSLSVEQVNCFFS